MADAVFSFSCFRSYAIINQLEPIAKEIDKYGKEVADGE